MNYPGTKMTITLFSPLTLEGGSKLEKVSMREPLVRDRIEYARRQGSDMEKEAQMIAELCGMNADDIYRMTAADYAQLEDAFNLFLLPPGERVKPTSEEG